MARQRNSPNRGPWGGWHRLTSQAATSRGWAGWGGPLPPPVYQSEVLVPVAGQGTDLVSALFTTLDNIYSLVDPTVNLTYAQGWGEVGWRSQ